MITQLNLFAFGFLFVELAVVTPVEHRNFVSVVSEARKSKRGPMSIQNIRVKYIKTVSKQKIGRKS